ncbi:MAG: GatB/YqeY domain-containing protein [Alphaproteobacteria bacterium]|jgi:hypothetical protein
MGMRTQFTEDMKAAMRSGDKQRLATLRLIIAAVKEKDISARGDGQEDGINEDEILAVLTKMVKQREESAKVYDEGGRPEMAASERAEMEIIRGYMPAPLTEEELKAAISNAIADANATCLKDMGRVMGLLKERHAGQIDFGSVSPTIRTLLQQG